MKPHVELRWNSWAQLLFVLVIVVSVNVFSSKHFLRLDMTQDRNYSLDISTQALVWKLDKPLIIKVYFSENLQAPYNNHQAALLSKLEELRAYSKGWLQIEVLDPTNVAEKEEEAQRFGIEPIEYRYRGHNSAELKKVFMGAALVYGDRQETLPAITQVETLEYDLARALRALLMEEPERKIIGFTVGNDEPDFRTASGPLASLRDRLLESYDLMPIELGGSGAIDKNVDVLWVIGPQRTLSPRALYQIDQFIMKGGAVGFFLTNSKADMRSMSPQNLYHGLEPLLGHYGVTLNRDILVDRVHNGRMSFPVRYGNTVRPVQINYPLIPKLTEMPKGIPVTKGLDAMLAPFSSSLELVEVLAPGVEGEIWVASSNNTGRLRGVVTLDPKAFQIVNPGEEVGSWGVVAGLTGSWRSYFAQSDIPLPVDGSALDVYESSERIRDGANARMVVVGSADFVANNVAFMLNLADWMVQDEELINIRSKVIRYNTFEALDSGTLVKMRLWNLFGGMCIIGLIAGLRWIIKRGRK